MFKIKQPKIKKTPMVRPRRPFGMHTAFGVGQKQAFAGPSTMVTPDQAFTTAMAQPQDQASLPPPSEG